MQSEIAISAERKKSFNILNRLFSGGNGLIVALLVLVLVASLMSPQFLQPANLINVLRQVALYGIVSIGMTFVILTAGIDISVGSVIGVVAVVSAELLLQGYSIPVTVLLSLGLGVLAGLVNGAGVTFGRVPPFIMTLGMMVIARGLAFTFSNGQPIYPTDMQGFQWLGAGFLLGLPVPVWIFAFVAAVAWIVLAYTPYGRAIYATGSNPEAARLSGINTRNVVISVYVIAGLLAALTGLILVSRLTVGEPTAGMAWELEAITIAVIGGASLFGGEGNIRGTIIGAMILAILANLLNLFGISPFTQQIVKGVIIIAAILFEVRRHHH